MVRDGAWVLAGQALTALVLLVSARVTTELVSDTAVLGQVTLILGLVTLARNIFCAPVLQAQFRFYPDSARTGDLWRLRRVTTRALRWAASPLLAMMVVAGVAYAYRTGAPPWAYLAPAALLVVELGRGYESNFLIGARRQKAVTAMGVADALARPAFMVLMVLCLGPTPYNVMWGYAIGSGVAYVMVLAVVHREGVARPGEAGPTDGEDRRLGRELWRYAMPIVPLAVVGWVMSLSDRFILGWWLGAQEVGVYAVTYGLISQPFLQAHGVLSRTLTPIYYKAVADGNADVERRSFFAWLAGTVAVSAMGTMAIWLLKGWIARLLLAPEYRGGEPLMPWIAGGYMMYGIGCVFEARLYARKLTGRVLAANSIVALASIVAPAVFLYYWGLLGVAMACPVYFGVMVMVMAAMSRCTRRGGEESIATDGRTQVPGARQ